MLHAWEGTSSTFPTSPNKPLEHFHTELNTNYSKKLSIIFKEKINHMIASNLC